MGQLTGMMNLPQQYPNYKAIIHEVKGMSTLLFSAAQASPQLTIKHSAVMKIRAWKIHVFLGQCPN